ncbi:hypothetical protein ERO13_D01G119450v2, partial [Gossypium hirsutum]
MALLLLVKWRRLMKKKLLLLVGGDIKSQLVRRKKVMYQIEEKKMKKRKLPGRIGLDLTKKSGDDDEEGPRGGDLDMEYDDIEKGDDWEHEEIFTDDDEAVGNDPEERDLAPEVPAPLEIKEDEDEEDEEQGGGLSKSGKELKKLLRKASGLND